MLVEIVDIEELSAAEPWVEVRSALGRFAGRWHGPAPRVGDYRDVELAFDVCFAWGGDAVPVEPRPHAIGPASDGGVVLWATVERLGDDDHVGLRLGLSIVMLTAYGDPPPLGATVRIDAPAVKLFDTNM